jgi:CRP/FNR family cyclic AMP-dependent transcriptional regulator
MLDLFERLLLLKQSAIFSAVNTDDLRIVARALDEERYFAGERVFDIGEQGEELYILVEGRIGISISQDPASTEFIATLAAGDCFGEMNMLDDQPRSATAHVLEDATVLALGKSRLRGLILSYPEISIGMLRSLSLRLREANLRSLNTARRNGNGRNG